MLVILGGPGSGKGTQGRMVSEALGVNFISAGDILKIAVKDNKELTNKINSGIILEDNEVNEIIIKSLRTMGKGDVFEGFPRTMKQAKYLAENFDLTKIAVIIILEVDSKIIIDRLNKRYICAICQAPYQKIVYCCNNQETIKREDDKKIETIINRINNFHHSVSEVGEFFQKHGVPVIKIDGNPLFQQVKDNIIKCYEGITSSKNKKTIT